MRFEELHEKEEHGSARIRTILIIYLNVLIQDAPFFVLDHPGDLFQVGCRETSLAGGF
jgi:hypothetical protein